MFSEVDIRDDFRSNNDREFLYGAYRPTRTLVLFFTFVVACLFLLTIVFWVEPEAFPQFYSQQSSGHFSQPRQQNPLEIQQGNERLMLGIFSTGLGVCYFILFLKLMARFHHNAVLFKGSRLESSQGFFLLSWFLPFANLYFPFRTTKSILDFSRPRKRREFSSSDRLLMALWVTLFLVYVLAIAGFTIVMENSQLLVNGEIPLMFRVIDSANSIANVVLLCLLSYRIDHYQTIRAQRPDNDAQVSCNYCGEPVAMSEGNCPMCGRKIPVGTVTQG